MSNTALITFAAKGHCFVALPQPLAERILKRSSQQNTSQTVLELSWTHQAQLKKVYVGWAGDICFSSSNDPVASEKSLPYCIELDPVFGDALGLSQFQKVSVKVLQQVTTAERVFVEPVTEDDWEMLEWHASTLEQTLLTQINVVFPSQHLPVHTPHGKGTLHLVVQADPDLAPCRVLATATELAVKPKPRSSPPRAACLRVCASTHASSAACVSPRTYVQLLHGTHPPALLLTPLKPALRSALWQTWTPAAPPPIAFAASAAVRDHEIHVPAHLALAWTWFPDPWHTAWNTHGARVKCVATERGSSDRAACFAADGDNTTTTNENEAEKEGEATKSASSCENAHGAPPSFLETLAALCTAPAWQPHSPCVTGPAGCGKTYLVQALLKRVEDHPSFPFTLYVPCDRVAAETPVAPLLQDVTTWAYARRPSIVVLDNVDHWIPGAQEDMKQSDYLAWQLVKAITSLQQVVFVLVAKSAHALHPMMKEYYAIQKEIVLGQGTVEELTMIYSSLLPRYSCSKEVLPSTLASLSEGFVAQDCVHVCQRAHYLALKDPSQHHHFKHAHAADPVPFSITLAHFEETLTTYRPTRLAQGIQKDGGVRWDQVGGMFQVKQRLLEIFQWPLRYPTLLASCGSVKLPKGVLLYGYPGCGKTWIGSAIAKEAGMACLMVRGPELLDKYVGGSEARVRDVFQRARRAAPCLVFMDELDALVPRRGDNHVTDRIVNQVLTELDGVDGREGVYVVGATSRPELIDPAMLRPGRLDLSLLCGLPDLKERIHVCSVLCPQRADADWSYWAERTEGLTCADLQGWITQAQLEAVQERVEQLEVADELDRNGTLSGSAAVAKVPWKSDPEGEDLSKYVNVSPLSTSSLLSSTSSSPVQVNDVHLQRALETLTPSLNEATRQRLTRIYELFAQGKTETSLGGKLKFK